MVATPTPPVSQMAATNWKPPKQVYTAEPATTLNTTGISSPLPKKENYNEIEFVDLQTPEIREVDRIWARELFGDEADAMMDKAKRLLAYLGNKRNG